MGLEKRDGGMVFDMESLAEIIDTETQMRDKLRSCKSAEELIAIAKEQGFMLTNEQADELLKAISCEPAEEKPVIFAGEHRRTKGN